MTELDGGGHEEPAGSGGPADDTPSPATRSGPLTSGLDLRGRHVTYEGWTPPADDPLFGGPRTYSFSFDHLTPDDGDDPAPRPGAALAAGGSSAVPPGTDDQPVAAGSPVAPGSPRPSGPASPGSTGAFTAPVASPTTSPLPVTSAMPTGPGHTPTGPGRAAAATGPGWPGRYERPASRMADGDPPTGPDPVGPTRPGEGWRLRGWSGEPGGPGDITPLPRVRGFGGDGFDDPDLDALPTGRGAKTAPDDGTDDPFDDRFDDDGFDDDGYGKDGRFGGGASDGGAYDGGAFDDGAPRGGGGGSGEGDHEDGRSGDRARRPRRMLVVVAGAVLLLIAAVAVVALRGGGGGGDGGQAPAPVASAALPQIPPNFLDSVTTDSDPIVANEFFPEASVDVNARGYRRIAQRLDSGCPQLTGDLAAQFTAAHCRQVVRSLFLTNPRQGERQVLVGATVFNLDTSTTATQGAQVLNQGRGGIMPLPIPAGALTGAQITGPGGNNSWRGAISRGHYLIYTQVAYVDGTQGAAADTPLRNAQNDLAVLATEPIGDRAVLGHGPRR